jgi:hypothetical protein
MLLPFGLNALPPVFQLVVLQLQARNNCPVNPVLHRLDGPSISPPEFNVFFGLKDLQRFL